MLQNDKKQVRAKGTSEVSEAPVKRTPSVTESRQMPKVAPRPSSTATTRQAGTASTRPSNPRVQEARKPNGGTHPQSSGAGASAGVEGGKNVGANITAKKSGDERVGIFSILNSIDFTPFSSVKKYNTPCIIVIAVMILYLISEGLLAGNYINSENPYVTVVIAQICVYLLPCAFFLAFSSLRKSFSARDLGFAPAPLRLIGFCIASLFALVVGGMLIKYSAYLIFGTVSASAVSVSASNDLLYVMLSGVVIPAITEELLFRGVLYGAYEKKLGGIGAILITSLLFAFIHFDTVNFVSYLYAGLVLGIAACVTRSVFAPMLLHLLNNFICIFSDTYLQRISKESISTVFVIFILGVIFLVILFFYFESLEIYCRERALSDARGQNQKTVGLFIEGEARYVMLIRGFLAPAFLVAVVLYFVKVLLL